MRQNLVVSVLGNRNSGKSHTWNMFFGAVVRTGSQIRRLCLSATEYIEVFLVSGSPEKRAQYVGDIIWNSAPRIVLCSMQYRQDVAQTIDYFVQHDYFLFMHWLNPGYSDANRQPDTLGLIRTILADESLLGVRDGQANGDGHVREMRDFIFGLLRRICGNFLASVRCQGCPWSRFAPWEPGIHVATSGSASYPGNCDQNQRGAQPPARALRAVGSIAVRAHQKWPQAGSAPSSAV